MNTMKKQWTAWRFFFSMVLLALGGAWAGAVPGLYAKAPLVKGADWRQLGSSVPAMALAGASIGESVGIDLLADDPTAAARSLRQNAKIKMLGISTASSLFGFGYAIPTSYGVFGVDLESQVPISDTGSMSDPVSEVGYFSTLSASFSKRISRFIDFGFRLHIDYALLDTDVLKGAYSENPGEAAGAADRVDQIDIPVGVNIDLGVSILDDTDILKNGFSVRNLRYGFMIRNAGLVPFYTSKSGDNLFVKVMDIFNLGFGFDFVSLGDVRNPFVQESDKGRGFVSRLVVEAGLNYPINFHIRGGIRSSLYTGFASFTEFSFSVASFYNPLLKEIFPFTTGFGFHFKAGDVDLALRGTALLLKPEENYTVDGVSIGIALDLRFGYRDISAPDIKPTDLEGEGEIPFNPDAIE